MSDEHVQPEPRRRRDPEDDYEEEKPRKSRRRSEEDRDYDDDDDRRIRKNSALETLIPYNNAMALIAYYLGVFGLIPCLGLLLGPAALVLGILGLNYKKKHPTAGGAGHAIAGIVLGTLVLLGHLGVILFFVITGANER